MICLSVPDDGHHSNSHYIQHHILWPQRMSFAGSEEEKLLSHLTHKERDGKLRRKPISKSAANFNLTNTISYLSVERFYFVFFLSYIVLLILCVRFIIIIIIMLLLTLLLQLVWTDVFCSIFFFIDIVACFLSSPNRRHYASSLITIVNFLSLIPTAINSIIEHIDPDRCLYRFRVFTIYTYLPLLFSILYYCTNCPWSTGRKDRQKSE